MDSCLVTLVLISLFSLAAFLPLPHVVLFSLRFHFFSRVTENLPKLNKISSPLIQFLALPNTSFPSFPLLFSLKLE